MTGGLTDLEASVEPVRRLEVVAEPGCGLPLAVHDPDLVRQVQHQVASAAVAVAATTAEPLPDRLELERQVVAERPVQAEMGVRTLAGWLRPASGRNAAMISRNAEKTVGRLLRSSSVKTSSLSAISTSTGPG